MHIHILGAFYAEDVLALGKTVFRAVDWHCNHFIEMYQECFGELANPIEAFEAALKDGPAGIEHLRKLYTYTEADGGDFKRFQAKFNFFLCLWDYYSKQGQEEALLRHMVERYCSQGLDYIEFRYGVGIDPTTFIAAHTLRAQVLQAASHEAIQVRYIIGLPRWAALEGYALVQQLLDMHPELLTTIVGVDFCGFEEGYPPKALQPFFEQVASDNLEHPERALDIVYHVGESFFDKTLESAIRWCHEIAELGAQRLGHAIALGLEPALAIARKPQAHVWECVSERLDQIAYDWRYREQLAAYGISINEQALTNERQRLLTLEPAMLIAQHYTEQRLAEIWQRQQFVLDRLQALGTVIECCPTSNLRIGGIPDAAHHPIQRFLASGVNLVICSDDPGTFEITLASEVEWVREQTSLSSELLEQRLDDPRRFRLGQQRPVERTASSNYL